MCIIGLGLQVVALNYNGDAQGIYMYIAKESRRGFMTEETGFLGGSAVGTEI